MRFRLIAMLALAGCGSEEAFELRLGGEEVLIEQAAIARLAKTDEFVGGIAVGDFDGDGIDDAIIGSAFVIPQSNLDIGEKLYVLYGGAAATAALDLATLPTLTSLPPVGPSISDVTPVGDVDGDGLADLLIGAGRVPGCGGVRPETFGGAYLIYGRTARFAGATPIPDAGVFFRDELPCTDISSVTALGDVDGDGRDDIALARTTNGTAATGKIFVFYGGPRRTGQVELPTADAIVTTPDDLPLTAAGIGDVDGDGRHDFMIQSAWEYESLSDIRLVRGSATRLQGTLTLDQAAAARFAGIYPCLPSGSFAERLGDLDGDGFDDFGILGCRNAVTPNPSRAYRLFYGRAAGFHGDVDPNDADARLAMTGDGATALAAGDVDGDGIRDLVASDSGLHEGDGGVHVIRGDGARMSGTREPGHRSTTYIGRVQPLDPDDCLYPPCFIGEAVGNSLGVGDLTGDHRADLLVGAIGGQWGIPISGSGMSRTRVYLVAPGANR
jgi:hypothetical protein